MNTFAIFFKLYFLPAKSHECSFQKTVVEKLGAGSIYLKFLVSGC